MQDYLRTIRLGYGKGEPGKKACWMTALQSHMGGEWTDRCDCVDPSINSLCIRINDIYKDNDTGRTEDILEFGLFAPLGTKDELNQDKRMFRLVDAAVRSWCPYALRLHNLYSEANKLEQLQPIVDKVTAAYAVDAAYAVVRAVANAAYAANAVANAAYAANGATAAYAAYAAAAAANGATAAYAAAAAANGATAAPYAVDAAARGRQAGRDPNYVRRDFLKEYVYPVLRELIEMGAHAPQEPVLPVCGVEKFQELVGINNGR